MANPQRKARPKCRIGQKRFTVVVINRDSHDSYAARSFERALNLAQPNRGSRVDVYVTCAKDAGEARMPSVYRNGTLTRSFRYNRG